jgi:hypothetical protein
VPLTCASRISQVVVYARGAMITRRLELPSPFPDGEADLTVPGITALAESGSMRATLAGGPSRSVTSVQTALTVPPEEIVVGPSVERVADLSRRLVRLGGERASLEERRGALDLATLEPGLAARAKGELGQIAARADDAIACARLLSSLSASLDQRVLALASQISQLERELEAARLQDSQRASKDRIVSGHPTRDVTLRVTGRGPVSSIDLSYAVPAARWWPVYTLRLTEGGKRASWLLEALVAQLTAEDWAGAEVALSTADLIVDARLPELPSIRLGRAQPTGRASYREPPIGLDRMFESYDRVFAVSVSVTTTVTAMIAERLEHRAEPAPPPREVPAEAEFEGADEASGAFEVAASALGDGGLVTKAAPMTLSVPAPGMARSGVMRKARTFGGAGGAPPRSAKPPSPAPAEPVPLPIEPADAWLDFDSLRLVGPDDRPSRGRLTRRAEDDATVRARTGAASQIESLRPSSDLHDPLSHRGSFDHRYEAAGQPDVPSDGLTHRVALGSAEAGPIQRWRTAPREAPEVYREVELKNPFDAPLLRGPVDVYVDGSLLVTTPLEGIDRGGTVRLGLGVEDRIRVARNVRVEEDSAGLLGGSTAVRHSVAIDLTSSLGAPSTVEVLDRIPVTDDKNIDVKLVSSEPASEPYKQEERGKPIRGGIAWRIALQPGGKRTISYQYRITLPAKSELAGGNRRE